MASVNMVILVGRLGKDPELRYTAQGTAMANFSVATSERVKGEERTEWHRVVAFGRTAEACGQYLAKGSQVYMEGRLQTRQWEDRNGNKRSTTEVVASRVLFLDSKPKHGEVPSHRYSAPPVDDGDVPF